MTHKHQAAELTSVGDFMLVAAADTKTVQIVTGVTYGGSRRINERQSDPALNCSVPVWNPKVEEMPAADAPARIDSLLEHYNKLADSKFGSGISLDTRDFARNSRHRLTVAKQELAALQQPMDLLKPLGFKKP